ncbi:hypothetical protein BDY17DRAFT_87478 [Neohortaea acidophila]|uniref:Uncharacterized protein n=1 Tax=Neohortaea acidophila TaxID=245834 RepID=A0A6A6Q630_9PEZI|nr:uncharacterized protein BDY17DRAFT_87478 [Neohortaea acidophila]KAF2486867.1 hypothetical protein BDY17DRAFT_87478 [Neohortaea acidophila]
MEKGWGWKREGGNSGGHEMKSEVQELWCRKVRTLNFSKGCGGEVEGRAGEGRQREGDLRPGPLLPLLLPRAVVTRLLVQSKVGKAHPRTPTNAGFPPARDVVFSTRHMAMQLFCKRVAVFICHRGLSSQVDTTTTHRKQVHKCSHVSESTQRRRWKTQSIHALSTHQFGQKCLRMAVRTCILSCQLTNTKTNKSSRSGRGNLITNRARFAALASDDTSKDVATPEAPEPLGSGMLDGSWRPSSGPKTLRPAQERRLNPSRSLSALCPAARTPDKPGCKAISVTRGSRAARGDWQMNAAVGHTVAAAAEFRAGTTILPPLHTDSKALYNALLCRQWGHNFHDAAVWSLGLPDAVVVGFPIQ